MRTLSMDLRERIVDAFDRGEGAPKELAKRFSVCLASVYNLLKRRKETGSLAPKPHGGGRKLLLEGEIGEALAARQDADPDATLADLGDYLYERFQKKVSVSTVWRALGRFDYSVKKKTLVAAEQDREDVQAARQAFVARQITEDPAPFRFLDETGLKTNMVLPYGRSKRGVRILAKTPYGHYQLTSVIATVSLDGKVVMGVLEGPMDGACFEAYVEGLLLPTIKPGQVIFLDNLTAHKNERVRQLVEGAGAHLVFLPPYSPDLNPIEKMWSKFKRLIRRAKPRSLEALQKAIAKALKKIIATDCQGYYASCGYSTAA